MGKIKGWRRTEDKFKKTICYLNRNKEKNTRTRIEIHPSYSYGWNVFIVRNSFVDDVLSNKTFTNKKEALAHAMKFMRGHPNG